MLYICVVFLIFIPSPQVLAFRDYLWNNMRFN